MDVDHAVVRTARELRPMIAAGRTSSEAEAHLSADVLKAAGTAGLFRLYAPKEVGGLEVPPHVAVTVAADVSAEDPAVGWIIGNSMPACMATAWLEPATREALFAEPDRNFGLSAASTGRAVEAPGGYRLTGEWPVVSGVETAKWSALAGFVADADGRPRQSGKVPDQRLFLVPTEDLEITPIWSDSVAMRGTASQQVRVRDAFVPEDFAFTSRKPLRIDRPLYRIPYLAANVGLFGGVCVGVLGAALEAAAADIGARVSTVHGGKATSNGAILEMVSRADAAHRAVRAGVIEAACDLWCAAVADGSPSERLRAAAWSSTFYAAEIARAVTSELYARSSRASFFRGHALERAVRDIHAISYGLEPLRPFEHGAGLVRMGQAPGLPI